MGLKKNIFVRISMVLTLSAIIVSAIVIFWARGILLDDMRDKGESIARVLSAVTLDSMLTYDYGTMERYVSQLADDRDIKLLRVVRTDGELMAEAGKPGREGNVVRISYPIEMGGTRLGEVEVLFSLEKVNAFSRKIIVSAVVFVLLIHVIGFAVNNFILERLVIGPVQALIAAVRSVKEGELQSRIDSVGQNEFGELAQAFNDMASSLEKGFADLERGRKAVLTEKGKLETIVGSLADGLFVSDDQGVIISFNRAAESISGYMAEEARGLHCEEVFKTKLCEDACALHNENKTIRSKETEIVTKDGRRLMVSVSSAILRDSDGGILGGVQTFRDISEEKQRQAMLCQAEKLAAVGRMSAGLAHEINNPLGNIVGYAKLLLQDEDADSRRREKLQIIAEQALKGSEIVRGLLDFSRQTGGEKIPVSLVKIAENVIRLFRPQAEKKGVRLAARFSDVPEVKADPKQLEQVLYNLLLNAFQAVGPAGTVSIEIFSAGPDRVAVRVSDDGPGIRKDQQEKIFDPFFTTKPAGEGTGLGLSICMGIVKDHGGTIEVVSEEGKGAVFTVELPAARG